MREQALGIIESGEDLRRWEESPKDLSRRRKVLDELRAKLLGPMPEAKKIPKRFRDSNDWPIGSIVGYRLSSGKLVLFRVATHHTDKGGTSPIVDVLDWQGDEIPSEGTIRKLRVLKPLRSWDNGRLLIGATSKREYPADRVLVTGLVVEPRPEGLRLPWTKPKPEQDKGCSGSLWRVLDRILDEIFALK